MPSGCVGGRVLMTTSRLYGSCGDPQHDFLPDHQQIQIRMLIRGQEADPRPGTSHPENHDFLDDFWLGCPWAGDRLSDLKC